jgi:hypothetical protein
MKSIRYNLGTGMVAQLIKYRTEQQISQAVPIKQKDKDNDFLSSRFLKVFISL